MTVQAQLENLIRQSIHSIMSDMALCIEKKGTLTDMVSVTKRNVDAIGRNVLSLVIKETERQYDLTRNKHEVIVRNRNKKRHLLTEFGELIIEHTLYFDKKKKRYFFAIDELLKMQKHSRIEENLQAKLLKTATETSYGKASDLAGNIVSRQSVFNLTKKVKDIEAPYTKVNKEAKEIFIEADEDHVHLKNGRSGEVKLAYVHEGRVTKNGRVELVNPRYFTHSDADELWNDVSMYLLTRYRPYQAKLHLLGDGATWIRNGLNMFPRMEYSIDKFHISKALIGLSAGNKALLSRLKRSVYTGNKVAFYNLCNEIVAGKVTDKARKIAEELILYISENFDTVRPGSVCSAEGHVSHVLSARLSSRPMAWTKLGVAKMASLRVYKYNKGDFLHLMQRNSVFSSAQNGSSHSISMPAKDSAEGGYSIPGLSSSAAWFSSKIKSILNN